MCRAKCSGIFEPNLYVFAFMPLLADWMYTIVFVMGGEEASRLLNVFFLFVVCINLRIIVKICGGNARVADIGMILFLLTPLTLHETQSMFVENIFCILYNSVSNYSCTVLEEKPLILILHLCL